MELTKEALIAFADDVEILIERKKDANSTVAEAFDGFVKEYDGISKKNLKKAVTSYIKFKNDRIAVLNEINETDLLFDMLTGDELK